MKLLPVLFIIGALLSWSSAWATSCCLGSGPKSFLSLQRLQAYGVGIGTSFRDVFGRFTPYGELESAEKNQTVGLLVGGAARVTDTLEISATLPIVRQITDFGTGMRVGQGFGDILVGTQWIFLESLFVDDWYPTLSLLAGTKAPTGSEEANPAGKRVPGTGNGLWEPYAGVLATKSLGSFTLGARATYTARLSKGDSDEGDGIELLQSASYAVSPRLSIAAGVAQSWWLLNRQGGNLVEGSHGRVVSGFLSPSLFITRVWSVSAVYESALPFEGLSVNRPGARTVLITTRYGFF